MRALLVSGGDYSALTFQDYYKNIEVSYVLDNLEHFQEILIADGDEETELVIVEVGEVSEEFLEFARRELQDHDGRKHKNFWLENETL